MSFSFAPTSFVGAPLNTSYRYDFLRVESNNGQYGEYSWGTSWYEGVSLIVLNQTSPWGNLSAVEIVEFSGVSSYFTGPNVFSSYGQGQTTRTSVVSQDTPWSSYDQFSWDQDSFWFRTDVVGDRVSSEYHSRHVGIDEIDWDGMNGSGHVSAYEFDSFDSWSSSGNGWSNTRTVQVSIDEQHVTESSVGPLFGPDVWNIKALLNAAYADGLIG